MLGIRRHDLVVRSEVEPGDDDVAAVRGRARERDALGRRFDEPREPLANAPAQRQSGPARSARVREKRTLTLKSPQRSTGSFGPAIPSTKTAARSSSASARRLSG